MKFSGVAIAAAALASSATHAAECDLKIYNAVNIPELEKCESETGFDFVALTTPTDDVKAKFCTSQACLTVWKAAKDIGLEECMIRGKQLYKGVLDPLDTACKKTGALSSAKSANSSSHEDSHDSHDHSHKSGSMDSPDDNSSMKAPSNSTKPTTAPSSASSPLSLAAGVVTLSFTVIAAFL